MLEPADDPVEVLGAVDWPKPVWGAGTSNAARLASWTAAAAKLRKSSVLRLDLSLIVSVPNDIWDLGRRTVATCPSLQGMVFWFGCRRCEEIFKNREPPRNLSRVDTVPRARGEDAGGCI